MARWLPVHIKKITSASNNEDLKKKSNPHRKLDFDVQKQNVTHIYPIHQRRFREKNKPSHAKYNQKEYSIVNIIKPLKLKTHLQSRNSVASAISTPIASNY